MLRDIVQDVVEHQPDMELFPGASVSHPKPRRDRVEPEVVVVASTDDPGDAGIASGWLHRWPHSRVLVVDATGRQSVMFELRPHATRLGDLSPQQLVDAIRSGRRGGGSNPPARQRARR